MHTEARSAGDWLLDDSELVERARAGDLSAYEYQVFPARAEGEPGHYVATVTLPAVGDWTWEVDPHSFPIQPLGSITVTAPAPASAAATAGELEPPIIAALVAASLLLTPTLPIWAHWRQCGVTQGWSPTSPTGGSGHK